MLWPEGITIEHKVSCLPEVQSSFHFSNFSKKVGIVVLICIIQQMCSKYFDWVFNNGKFHNLCIFLFWRANPHCFGYFLFRFKPDMLPKLLICEENLREFVSLDIRVVSSANCEIVASCGLGRLIPLQFGSWRILKASNSTDSIERNGLNGHPWQIPLDTLWQFVIKPAFITAVSESRTILWWMARS